MGGARNRMAWPDRPKGLSERSYRRYMARKKEVRVNGTVFTLQSISPQSYMDINDEHGMTGGRRDTSGYIDELFRNVVVEPAEVRAEGIEYFNKNDDIGGTEKLLKEIESFLRQGK